MLNLRFKINIAINERDNHVKIVKELKGVLKDIMWVDEYGSLWGFIDEVISNNKHVLKNALHREINDSDILIKYITFEPKGNVKIKLKNIVSNFIYSKLITNAIILHLNIWYSFSRDVIKQSNGRIKFLGCHYNYITGKFKPLEDQNIYYTCIVRIKMLNVKANKNILSTVDNMMIKIFRSERKCHETFKCLVNCLAGWNRKEKKLWWLLSDKHSMKSFFIYLFYLPLGGLVFDLNFGHFVLKKQNRVGDSGKNLCEYCQLKLIGYVSYMNQEVTIYR